VLKTNLKPHGLTF